jgi:hypothetical protein
MKNIKLLDLKEDIERGAILRCTGKYPYEEYVDFMVIELLKEESKRIYALLVVSGYKAGLIYVEFPEACIPLENNGFAISTEWLKLHWYEWGYFECVLEDVHVIYKDPPIDLYS